MNRLDGKVAVITGGARGNGGAAAELFVEAGATVIIADVLDDVGSAAAERLGENCCFEHHDVTSEADWSTLVAGTVERHSKIDVLVNNAGIFQYGGVLDTSLDDWHRMMAVNQTGVFLGMQAVAPSMRDSGSGSIVNVSSIAGLKSAAIAHAYAATKWAVRGMSRSAAVELAPFGVRVNSIHPGLIDTPMLNEFARGDRERLQQQIPLGRVGTPEEVGRLVLFLASDDSSYCTGHEFVADGAMIS